METLGGVAVVLRQWMEWWEGIVEERKGNFEEGKEDDGFRVRFSLALIPCREIKTLKRY